MHSHYEHLFALLKFAKEHGVEEVYVHGFLDGRDVGPTTALGYIEETEKQMKKSVLENSHRFMVVTMQWTATNVGSE